MEPIDLDIRHFIYRTFSQTSIAPSSAAIAEAFNLTIFEVQSSLNRLASEHHIALAPGSANIWMAHPFSTIPTNFSARVESKKFWGN